MSPRRRRIPPRPVPRELALDEVVVIFRIVPTADRTAGEFVDAFRSRAELGLPPRSGTPEEAYPELNAGLSTYETREAAVKTEFAIRRIGRSFGDYVAELRLTSAAGARIASWGRRGHLTVWGDPLKLCEAVVDIVSIERGENGLDDSGQ